jgi:hypothetical protein
MQELYDALNKNISDDAIIDLLITKFNTEFSFGNYSKVNSILEDLDISGLNTVLLVAILAITYSVRDELFSRKYFLKRVRLKFEKTESHRVDRLLKNFA